MAAKNRIAGVKIKNSPGDKVFTGFNYVVTFLLMCITLYPLVYVFSMSISHPSAVLSNSVVLLPKGFSLKAYELVFRNMEIWVSYFNTIWYAVVGTIISVTLTMMAAYPLSRKSFCLRTPLSFFFSFTMLFSGTLIPTFILINNLGLYNTRWAIVLPGGATAWYIIMARTFLQSIPESLYESAKVDGAGEWRTLMRIFLPLSKPIMAVLVLYYAVAQWNSYFNAMIYLPDRSLQPLQVYLMRVLVQNESIHTGGGLSASELGSISLQLKYVVIIVAVVPILLFYPFLQKYFTKGVMVGSIKE